MPFAAICGPLTGFDAEGGTLTAETVFPPFLAF
jgi:hypothetical protein